MKILLISSIFIYSFYSMGQPDPNQKVCCEMIGLLNQKIYFTSTKNCINSSYEMGKKTSTQNCPELSLAWDDPNQCCVFDGGSNTRQTKLVRSKEECDGIVGTINPITQCRQSVKTILKQKEDINNTQSKPVISSGKKIDGNQCGDCVVKETLVDGVWKQWNGFDLTANGKFVKHITKLSECTSDNPKLIGCNIKDVVAEVDKPAKPEAKKEEKCHWLERQVVHVSPAKECSGCAIEQPVCMGRAYCDGGKYDEDPSSKLQQVVCSAKGRLCPESVDECMNDTSSVHCIEEESRQSNPALKTDVQSVTVEELK